MQRLRLGEFRTEVKRMNKSILSKDLKKKKVFSFRLLTKHSIWFLAAKRDSKFLKSTEIEWRNNPQFSLRNKLLHTFSEGVLFMGIPSLWMTFMVSWEMTSPGSTRKNRVRPSRVLIVRVKPHKDSTNWNKRSHLLMDNKFSEERTFPPNKVGQKRKNLKNINFHSFRVLYYLGQTNLRFFSVR